MTSNANLLAKADMTLSDLASGGALAPDMANTFVRKLLITPTMLREIRVVTMNGPIRKVNTIGFGTRILRPAISATALAPSDRAKPDLGQITLTTKEVIAEVRLPYDVLEDNVETATAANNEPTNTGPGGLRQTLIEMIAERVAVDLEEMGLLGNTAVTGQGTLSLVDGWLTTAVNQGHVVDAAGATISRDIFKNGVKAMPDPYLANRAVMRHYVSMDNETEYRDTVASRQTPLGDNTIQAYNPVYAFGAPILPISHMPGTGGLFTNPLNLLMGIQRQISMEYDKDITARVYIIVLTARVAFGVENADALVAYTNISGT